MRATSSSPSSRAWACGLTPALWHSSRAVFGPTPYKYVSAMTVGRSFGMSTPCKRGMLRLLDARGRAPPLKLTLALLVARVAADDVHHSAAADDLAFVANSLNAGFDFHMGTGPAVNASIYDA